MRTDKRQTIEKNYMYHLYWLFGRFYVDFYNGGIIHSYSTEAGAREAIKYHFG